MSTSLELCQWSMERLLNLPMSEWKKMHETMIWASCSFRWWFIHLSLLIFQIFSVHLCLKDTIVTAIFQYILLAPVLESLTCAGREKNSSGTVVTVYTPKKMNSLREQLTSIPWKDIVMYCEPTKPICIQKCKQRLTSLNSIFSMSDFTAFNN